VARRYQHLSLLSYPVSLFFLNILLCLHPRRTPSGGNHALVCAGPLLPPLNLIKQFAFNFKKHTHPTKDRCLRVWTSPSTSSALPSPCPLIPSPCTICLRFPSFPWLLYLPRLAPFSVQGAPVLSHSCPSLAVAFTKDDNHAAPTAQIPSPSSLMFFSL